MDISSRAFKQGHEDQPLVINEPNVTSIVGPARMTRSGRVFAPRTVDVSAKAKGKEVATHVQIPTPNVNYKRCTYLRELLSPARRLKNF